MLRLCGKVKLHRMKYRMTLKVSSRKQAQRENLRIYAQIE